MLPVTSSIRRECEISFKSWGGIFKLASKTHQYYSLTIRTCWSSSQWKSGATVRCTNRRDFGWDTVHSWTNGARWQSKHFPSRIVDRERTAPEQRMEAVNSCLQSYRWWSCQRARSCRDASCDDDGDSFRFQTCLRIDCLQDEEKEKEGECEEQDKCVFNWTLFAKYLIIPGANTAPPTFHTYVIVCVCGN